jgi:hypothetical protein
MMYFYLVQDSVFVVVIIVIPVRQGDFIFVWFRLLYGKESFKIVGVYPADAFGFFAVKTQHVVRDREIV